MKRLKLRSSGVILLAVLLAGLWMPAPDSVRSASAHSESGPVKGLLNHDGTLNLNTGFSGPLDLTGWDVTLDSTRGPVLTRQNREAPEAQSESNIGWSSEPQGVTPILPQAVGWSALPNSGLNDTVRAIAVSGSDVYVGGDFTATADGAVTNLTCIAKFSGGVWSALPNNGLNNTVRALAVNASGDLYVGGDFLNTADGALTNLNHIAKFSGGVWSALPNNGLSGVNVQALAVSGSDLYVGGFFTGTADGAMTNLNMIARLSAGVWSPLPNNGLNFAVQALAVSGSDLYVAGSFVATFDGAVLLNHIARFSGGAWSTLPNNGLNAAVHALAVSGSDLYVAGEFSATRDGTVTNLNGIAKLSGGVWSGLPNNGLNGIETALAVNGSDLYVGGAITQTFDGAVLLNNIARFGGGVWSPLPNNGLNAQVNALAVNGSGDLYAGGIFTATRDFMVTNLFRIARFSSPTPTPTCTFSLSPTSQNFTAGGGSSSVNVSTDVGCPWTVFREQSWITITSALSGSGNGTVNYTVAANPGPSRTGAITIAGQKLTVTQDALKTYTVGGSVSGLTGNGLVLRNNGGDDLTIGANGPFTFATALANGSAYSVTVRTQPNGQTCSVTNGAGTVSGANVTSVVVACAAPLNTPIGSNITVQLNGINITFDNVLAVGNTTVTPLLPPNPIIPQLPPGFVLFNNLAFDISTTAVSTGPIIVTFDLGRLQIPSPPPITPQVFAGLRVLHGEGGLLTDRTIPGPPPIVPAPPPIMPIFAKVSSLSPFVIAQLVNRPPVARCKNIEVAAGSSCTATINPSDVDAGSSDPDPGDSITLSLDSAGPFRLGPHTVTLTVTDNHGASSSCRATVTVKDKTPPTITAPPNVNATTGPGATGCGAIISNTTLGTAIAGDNCSPVTVSRSGVPAGNFFPVGTTAITYTATDASGNTRTATQSATVVDDTPPAITCPTNMTVEFTSEMGALVTLPAPAATDNCALASVVCLPPSGSVFPIGTTTVTCTASDASNNRATCPFTVTVLGARGVKQNVLAELTALRASVANIEDSDNLDEAIKKLSQSLDPRLWLDQTHLQSKEGKRAFDLEKDAVEELHDLMKDRETAIPDAVLQDFINRIVKSDRLLALVAINDAVAAHGHQENIDKARQEFAKGDSDVASGKYESGIEQYLNAWKRALKAVNKRWD